MNQRAIILLVVITLVVVAGIIGMTLVLTPEETNPAVDVAVEFANAAGQGDDDVAFALLGEDLQAYVLENCPDASVSACIDDYTPPEWGDMISSVYRRNRPVGRDWEILLISTYEEDQGFAGVCIFTYVEEVTEDDWRVTSWSGFVSCDGSNSGIGGLSQPDAPNRAP